MFQRFSRGGIEAGADLVPAATVLALSSAAVVRETLSRARLETLRRTGDPKAKINGEDLFKVAEEVINERKRFTTEKSGPDKRAFEAFGEAMEAAGSHIAHQIRQLPPQERTAGPVQ
jgi:hypothetical protein